MPSDMAIFDGAIGFFIAVTLVVIVALAFFLRQSKTLPVTSDSDEFALLKFKTINLDGIQVFYLEQGGGPIVFLIHGLGASSFIWRYQIAELSKNYKVIAIDLPGFGQSSKNLNFPYDLDSMTQFLLKFLDQIGIENTSLVGSSMGGTLALNMARIAPDKISKIALLAPATQPQLVPFGVGRLAWTSRWARNFINEKSMARIMGRVNANPAMINAATVQTHLRPYKNDKNAIATFIKATNIIRDRRLPKLFLGLDVDCLILYGEQDKVVPLWGIQRLQRILHCPLETNSRAGHHPQEDEAEWVNEKLHQFLNSKI